MLDLVIILALLLLIGGAIAYIVRQKKKGVKCIGCPNAGECVRSCKDRNSNN